MGRNADIIYWYKHFQAGTRMRTYTTAWERKRNALAAGKEKKNDITQKHVDLFNA